LICIVLKFEDDLIFVMHAGKADNVAPPFSLKVLPRKLIPQPNLLMIEDDCDSPSAGNKV
jgi:hypothetical protein